jgi:DNA processing protein
MTDTVHNPCLILSLCPQLGSRRALELIASFGSAAAVINAAASELRATGLGEETIRYIHDPSDERLTLSAEWLAADGRHLISVEHELFPPLLIESGEAPLCLFVEGDPAVLSLPQLAIVGSRKATPGGRETAAAFAAYLAKAGFVITSGLAEGIDTEAHAGALEADGLSVAVMGTGSDQIYPRSNSMLAQRLSQHGALISEFAPGTPPRKDHFPRRNRIISGLSLGVLVVEAGIRSGALITARYAGGYGREIFAIPGSIHNPLSKGCHRLIKQGAKLVETADDIVTELGSLAGTLESLSSHVTPHSESPANNDPEYAKLLDSMGFDPISIDRLAVRSGLTAEQLSSMLLILELEGKVYSVPGGYFQQTKV